MAQEPKKQENQPAKPAQPQPAAPQPQKSAAEIGAELAAILKQPEKPAVDVQKIAQAALAEVAKKRAEEASAPPAPGTPGKVDRWPDRQRKSSVSSPVKFVWELAEAMTKQDPTMRRKDIIAAAIANGVAGYTARTQYQAWYTAKRESARAAARAQEQQKATGTK